MSEHALPPDPFPTPPESTVGPWFESMRFEPFRDAEGTQYIALVFRSRLSNGIYHFFTLDKFQTMLESGALFLESFRSAGAVLESEEVTEEERRRAGPG